MPEQTTLHTPEPWTVDLDQTICFPDTDMRTELVFEVVNRDAGETACYATSEANAHQIVHDRNCLPKLLAALEALLKQITGPAQVYGNGIGRSGIKDGLSSEEFYALRDERIAHARLAIAEAKGTTP